MVLHLFLTFALESKTTDTKTQSTRHNRLGLFLLALYLMILGASVLHIHESAGSADVCHDCIEHVKHSGHISQLSIMDVDCVLCQILHTDYITPEVLTFSAAALLAIVLMMCPTPDIICRKDILPSLRAPPLFAASCEA